MIDGADASDPLNGHGSSLAALEQRVRRLEDAVAVVPDARQIEERVIERLSDRIMHAPPTALTTGLLIDVDRPRLPAPPPMAPAPELNLALGRRWFLFDLAADFRALFAMFADPRYHLSRQTRIIIIGLIAIILTSFLWLPGTAILPPFMARLLDKIVDLGLTYILYKILSREVRKYRSTAPDLPAHLRL